MLKAVESYEIIKEFSNNKRIFTKSWDYSKLLLEILELNFDIEYKNKEFSYFVKHNSEVSEKVEEDYLRYWFMEICLPNIYKLEPTSYKMNEIPIYASVTSLCNGFDGFLSDAKLYFKYSN